MTSITPAFRAKISFIEFILHFSEHSYLRLRSLTDQSTIISEQDISGFDKRFVFEKSIIIILEFSVCYFALAYFFVLRKIEISSKRSVISFDVSGLEI